MNTEQRKKRAQQPSKQILHGRYEILSVLGQGAQGKTYLARDRETAEQVAIKELVLQQVEDWKAIELFEREGEALRHLDHPGIPAYVDKFHIHSEDGSERFFLVQEFVDGEDYERLLEGLTWSEREAKDFLGQVLDILVYLQSRSPPVVHRDLKPSNIMRRRDGRVALIDFGAVQSVIPKAGGGSTIIGTSGYMPVEQLMGRAVPATDLFALGATVVHLLSGRHPADLPVHEMRLQFESFVNISDEFAHYLRSLLEPLVERRFQTATEARAALESLDRVAPAKPAGSKSEVNPRQETTLNLTADIVLIGLQSLAAFWLFFNFLNNLTIVGDQEFIQDGYYPYREYVIYGWTIVAALGTVGLTVPRLTRVLPILTPITAIIVLLAVLGLIFVPGPGWTFSAPITFLVICLLLVAVGRIFVAPVPARSLSGLLR